MVIHGTAHFVSIRTANRYYADYGYSEADVLRKITDGEIHIGKPHLQPGQQLSVIDEGCRYAIATD